MMLRTIWLTICFLVSIAGSTQIPSIPRTYFRNPLNIPIDLSANFGELRKDHWHMGLDIRTNQKENLPVHAAAQGYISQVGIRPQSFGRFIVIRHPNGLSTLYAHLNDFYPALESYVESEQYRQESWAVELVFSPEQFPVHKGQFIAFSGNTGGSQGPHLHFEIFDTQTEKRLNPLLFDLGVRDNVAPTVLKLAMYNRDKSIYEQSPKLFSLKKTDSGYVVPHGIIETGFKRVSFAIQANDKQSGSNNPNGIYSAMLYLDDVKQAGFIIDSIDYDETLYMNAHIDYSYKESGGVYLQQLSRLPGDLSSSFHSYESEGIIELNDTILHQVTVDVGDPHNNHSKIIFSLRAKETGTEPLTVSSASVHATPMEEYKLRRADFEADIPPSALYDDIPIYYFRTKGTQSNAASDLHQLNDPRIPLHKEITVRIKTDREIPEEWKDKLLVQRTGKGSTIRYSAYGDGWVTGKFGDFGKFQVVADIVPPSINNPGKGDTINLSASSRIIFTPSDNYGIVKKFRAELDGKWLRFTNDKSRNWIYKFDDRWDYGVRQLTVTVEDHAGNVTTKSWWIKRQPYTPPVKKKKSRK